MQFTREGQGGAVASEQVEEFGVVRNLTSKLSGERMNAELDPELDVALPIHWETLTGKVGGHKVSKSSGSSQEFEFNMAGISRDSSEQLDPDGISPADDLFFKGQLLPLHLPKRLQMVQKLSSPKLDSESEETNVTVSCFFQPSGLKYSPVGSDEGYLGSALVNSRCSSFHSQSSTNFWESDSPGEQDSGDSSSSRDSSGSCQDACPMSLPIGKLDKKYQVALPMDKEAGPFYQAGEHHPNDHVGDNHLTLLAERSLISSWLGTPSKWKVFFGLKKPSKATTETTTVDVKVSLDKNDKGMFGSTKSSKAIANMRLPRRGSFFSGEQKLTRKSSVDESVGEQKLTRKSSVDESVQVYQGGLFSFPDAPTGLAPSPAATCSGDGKVQNEHEGSATTLKARESLQKYLSILKPASSKVGNAKSGSGGSCDQAAAAEKTSRMVDVKPKASFSGNILTSHSLKTEHCQAQAFPAWPSSKASFSKPRSLSSPRSSLRLESGNTGSSGSRCKSPAKPSFSANLNLRIPSFSRSSRVSANVITAVSPGHSGLLNHSPSTMCELQSAIQGAIAHCKQSESAFK